MACQPRLGKDEAEHGQNDGALRAEPPFDQPDNPDQRRLRPERQPLGLYQRVGSNAQSCPGYGVGTGYGYNLAEQPAVVVESAGGPSSGTVDNIFYSYDNMGRLNSISTELTVDASGSTLTSTDFSGLTYYPGGAVETANLGIDPTSQIPAITLSRTYDNRGQNYRGDR